jgi:hypothetical protein
MYLKNLILFTINSISSVMNSDKALMDLVHVEVGVLFLTLGICTNEWLILDKKIVHTKSML